MSVGLLLITHDEVGRALLEAATTALGGCPLETRLLAVGPGVDPETALERASASLADLDRGDGVLVLTDLFGATPCNIAVRLCPRGEVLVVSGLNLPMLIRVMNYAALDLGALAEKAVSGGRAGIVLTAREMRSTQGA